MINLKNEVLQVNIDSPGEVYKESRFDWTGQISQILFEGKHTFLTTETTDIAQKRFRGIGMCHEYGISTPVGYNECPVGDYFLKIGIGLLKRETDEAYDFFKTYKVVPAEFSVHQENNTTLVIESTGKDRRGYEYKLTKKYTLQNNVLNIESTLENKGSKDIVTEEYCHNFLCIDNQNLDGTYELSFDINIDKNDFTAIVNPNDCTVISTEGFSWNSVPESDIFFSNVGKVNSWILKNRTSKVSITESPDFKVAYCNLWGKGHVLSPELFKEINLKPGKTESWTRKYTFNLL